jgi:actin related protein 2/3 complex subunit 5
MSVLTNIKETEMGGAVSSLNEDNLDVLMKYIYRGLADAKDCSVLLKWHAICVEKAGLGCIIRAMTESSA